MDTRAKLIRFFHGPFLSAVCKATDLTDTEENKEVVKQVIKDGFKIESMADLAAEEVGEVIVDTARMMAIEMGVMLPYPGEPDNIDQLTMLEFLALKKND